MAQKRETDKNLRPPKTTEEARERGRAGGLASGVARRKKKDMRAMAKILMEMPVSETQQRKLEALGVPADEATYQMAVLVSMLQESLKGNVKAATFVRDTFLGDMAVEVRREEIRQRKKESSERLAFDRERFEFQKDHGAAQSAEGLLADLIGDLQASREAGENDREANGLEEENPEDATDRAESSEAASGATEAAAVKETEGAGAGGPGETAGQQSPQEGPQAAQEPEAQRPETPLPQGADRGVPLGRPDGAQQPAEISLHARSASDGPVDP